MISRAELAIRLSRLSVFDAPKNKLEQYPTDSETASILLYNAFTDSALDGKNVADLGCGSGILGLGALAIGAEKCLFIDIDPDVSSLLQANSLKMNSAANKSKLICSDVDDFEQKVDTVVMNPPFGTRIKHADRKFLLAAFKAADCVYSIHKSATIRFLEAICRDNGMKLDIIDKRAYPLKASYGFHKSRIKKLDTVIIRCLRV